MSFDHTIIPVTAAKFATEADGIEKLSATDPHWYDFKHPVVNLAELVDRFRSAMLKLEGMTYAVYGAVPDWGSFGVNYYPSDPTNRGYDLSTCFDPTGLEPVWAPEPILAYDFGNNCARLNKAPAARSDQSDWWEVPNPRCLWPEQRGKMFSFDEEIVSCDIDQACDLQFSTVVAQYPAQGKALQLLPEFSTGGDYGLGPQGYYRGPQVPVRSRSGDPHKQFALGNHDRTIFPRDSVSRTWDTWDKDHTYLDAEGKSHRGWDPDIYVATSVALPDGTGFDPPHLAPITASYTPPGGIAIAVANLHWNVEGPGGSGVIPMVWDGSKWSANTPTAANLVRHGRKMRWYISAEDDQGVVYCDPHGNAGPTSPPTAYLHDPDSPETGRSRDAAYVFMNFTHVLGPYANGFPELLADHLGAPYNTWDPSALPGKQGHLKKGTESWKLDNFESIEPELINIARFMLDRIGEVCQHPPDERGSFTAACCFNMPITWRWSGSAPHWHYVPGGKGTDSGEPIPYRPLHTGPDEGALGAESARRSWRGIPPALFGWDPLDMPSQGLGPGSNKAAFEYGGDESWLALPETIEGLFANDKNMGQGTCVGVPLIDGGCSDCDDVPYSIWQGLYERANGRGLQRGDVIAPVHLEEIIRAVDYLLTKGCWRTLEVFSNPKTPSQNMLDSFYVPDNGIKLTCKQRHWYECGANPGYGDCEDGQWGCDTPTMPTPFCCEVCLSNPYICPGPQTGDTARTFCVDGGGSPHRRLCDINHWSQTQSAWGGNVLTGGACATPGSCYANDMEQWLTCWTVTSTPPHSWATYVYWWGFDCDSGHGDPLPAATVAGTSEVHAVVQNGWSAYICGPTVNDFSGPGGSPDDGWEGGTGGSYEGTDKLHGNNLAPKHATRKKSTPGRSDAGCSPVGSASKTPSYGNSFDEAAGVRMCGYAVDGSPIPRWDFDEIEAIENLGPGEEWWDRLDAGSSATGAFPCTFTDPQSYSWSLDPGDNCPPRWDLSMWGGSTIPDPVSNESQPLCRSYRDWGWVGARTCEEGVQCLNYLDVYDDACPMDDPWGGCVPGAPCFGGAGGNVSCDTRNPLWGGGANCNGDKVFGKIDWNLIGGVPRLHDYLSALSGSYGGDGSSLYRPSLNLDLIPWSVCPCETGFSWDEKPDGVCSYQQGFSCDNWECGGIPCEPPASAPCIPA